MRSAQEARAHVRAQRAGCSENFECGEAAGTVEDAKGEAVHQGCHCREVQQENEEKYWEVVLHRSKQSEQVSSEMATPTSTSNIHTTTELTLYYSTQFVWLARFVQAHVLGETNRAGERRLGGPGRLLD